MTFSKLNEGILVGIAENSSHSEEIAFELRAAAVPGEVIVVLGGVSIRPCRAASDADVQVPTFRGGFSARHDKGGWDHGPEAALVVVEIHDMDEVEAVESIFGLFECRTVPVLSGYSTAAWAGPLRNSAANCGERRSA